jgi:hypothetical protein
LQPDQLESEQLADQYLHIDYFRSSQLPPQLRKSEEQGCLQFAQDHQLKHPQLWTGFKRVPIELWRYRRSCLFFTLSSLDCRSVVLPRHWLHADERVDLVQNITSKKSYGHANQKAYGENTPRMFLQPQE